ncbi:hypothetical protein LINPERPRIM_LOCUS29581 [Linum perenne]
MEVLEIQELIRRDWEVKICQRYREANQWANFLANIGFRFPIGCHTISTSVTSLSYFLPCDYFGVNKP